LFNNDFLGCTEDTICTYNFTNNVSDINTNDLYLWTFANLSQNSSLTNYTFNTTTGVLTVSVTDDTEDNGIQIIPIAGMQRLVPVNVIIIDYDGYADIKNVNVILTGNGLSQEYNLSMLSVISNTSAEYSGNIGFNYYDKPGEYTVSVYATDSSSVTTSSYITVNYQELAAIAVDTSGLEIKNATKGSIVTIDGDNDFSSLDKPTIKNIGNAVLDLGIIGDELKSENGETGIPNITFSFDNSFNGEYSSEMTKDLTVLSIGLETDKLQGLGLRVEIPDKISKGNYESKITVVGVGR